MTVDIALGSYDGGLSVVRAFPDGNIDVLMPRSTHHPGGIRTISYCARRFFSAGVQDQCIKSWRIQESIFGKPSASCRKAKKRRKAQKSDSADTSSSPASDIPEAIQRDTAQTPNRSESSPSDLATTALAVEDAEFTVPRAALDVTVQNGSIYFVCDDGATEVLDLKTNSIALQKSLKKFKGYIQASFNPKHPELLLALSHTGQIRLYDIETTKPQVISLRHGPTANVKGAQGTDRVRSIGWTTDGKRIIATLTNTAIVHDPLTRQETIIHAEKMMSVVRGTEEIIAVGFCDGTIDVYFFIMELLPQRDDDSDGGSSVEGEVADDEVLDDENLGEETAAKPALDDGVTEHWITLSHESKRRIKDLHFSSLNGRPLLVSVDVEGGVYLWSLSEEEEEISLLSQLQLGSRLTSIMASEPPTPLLGAHGLTLVDTSVVDGSDSLKCNVSQGGAGQPPRARSESSIHGKGKRLKRTT